MAISIIIFILVLFAFSIFAAAVHDRQIGDTIVVSMSLPIIVLFLFGVAGHLFPGVIFILISSGFLILFSVIRSVVKKSNNIIKNIITKDMLYYLLFLTFMTICLHGKVFSEWDEFSHWGDIVRAMTIVDDFGTNQLSMSLFQSYPPGLSLLEYLIVRINLLVKHEFTEWLVYFAYNSYIGAFLITTVSKISRHINNTERTSIKNVWTGILTLCILAVYPLFFFSELYYTLLVDGCLSITFGTGLYLCYEQKQNQARKGYWNHCNIGIICILLVLIKDVGIYLAIVISIVQFVLQIKQDNKTRTNIIFITNILSIGIFRALWELCINRSNAVKMFSNAIDISEIIRVVSGNGSSYRQLTFQNYWKQLGNVSYSVGNTGIQLSLVVTVFFVLTLLFFVTRDRLRDAGKSENEICTSRNKIRAILIASLMIYVVGMLVMYMFKFSEYEATRTASIERYLAIPLCGISFFSLCCLLSSYISNLESKNTLLLLVFSIAFMMAPYSKIVDFVEREIVTNSKKTRETYAEISEKIHDKIESPKRLWIISQRDSGFDYWVIKYEARPNYVKPWQYSKHKDEDYAGWSIGEGPLYEGDLWTETISPLEWQEELTENYDYVVLYRADDSFKEKYGLIFEGDILDREIYKVDKNERKLILVE